MKIAKLDIQKLHAFICTIVLILGVNSLWATIHVVHFGGTLGLAYSPASFSANVGDTVQWVGDFSVHPLSSTTIPPNAPTWRIATGNSLNYHITVAGQYNYKCDVHAGMIGSFTASASRAVYRHASDGAGEGNRLLRIAFDASGQLSITITQLQPGPVMMELFDLLGRRSATVFDGIIQSGSTTVWPSLKISGTGLYCLRCTMGGRGSSPIILIR